MKKNYLLLIIILFLSGCQLSKPQYSSLEGATFVGFHITFQPLIEMIDLSAQIVEEQDSIPKLTFDTEFQDGYFMVVTKGGQTFTRDSIQSDELSIYSDLLRHGFNDVETVLKVTPELKHQTLYINHVYQSSDNRIYSIPQKEGLEVVITPGFGTGVSQKSLFKYHDGYQRDYLFTFYVQVQEAPKESIISEFNKQGLLIKETLNTDELTTFTPDPKSSYFIHQHTQHLYDEKIIRTIYQQSYDSIVTFVENEDGIIIDKLIPIQWTK